MAASPNLHTSGVPNEVIPLHIEASLGHMKKLLIQSGGDILAVNDWERTLLQYPKRTGKISVSTTSRKNVIFFFFNSDL